MPSIKNQNKNHVFPKIKLENQFNDLLISILINTNKNSKSFCFFAVAYDELILAVILTLAWVVLDYGLLLLYAYLFAKIANVIFIKISMILSAVVLLAFTCFGVISSLRDLL
ncbi:hypothetical protein MBO_07143 [Moraxella bovoculi 237]|uniref:Uncharacterized protein n=1 Tax=Moraxella bovoculi 237 TaxID=743974 RepID=A0A066UFU0_9GAMM|nr:hypothetical protein [Moraxella bovoculi]KDN24722.1 hypothetical protein MBO_07143 [Moraxella bovoculi 237]